MARKRRSARSSRAGARGVRRTGARTGSRRTGASGLGRTGVRAVLVLAAYPRKAPAERAARALVRDHIVACATVTSGARAVYFWEGREVSEPSALLWGKTTASRAREAIGAIRAGHPDGVPEILVLPVEAGEPSYLRWLEREVSRRTNRRPPTGTSLRGQAADRSRRSAR